MDQTEVDFFIRLLLLPALLIVAGTALVIATIMRNGKLAELRHRERMAMIERGMTPIEPPERVDGPRRARGFKLTFGIMLCGFGLGLGMLVAFAAGVEGVALGVGGAFVMLGLSFIASALVNRTLGDPEPGPRHAAAPPAPMPPPPPLSAEARPPADE